MADNLPPSDHLPPGFGWGWMYQGTRATLFYGPQPVADIQPSRHAWGVRTSLHRMLHQHRQARLSSRSLAIRYCEAYVMRWELEIRRELRHFGETRSFGPEYGPKPAPPAPGPQTTHSRRARKPQL